MQTGELLFEPISVVEKSHSKRCIMLNKLMYKSRRPSLWHTICLALLTYVILAVALWPSPGQSVVVEIPARLEFKSSEPLPSAKNESTREVTIEVQPGDSLSNVFERAGAGVSILYQLLADESINTLLEQIFPGQTFKFTYQSENTLNNVTFSQSDLSRYRIDINEEGFGIESIVEDPEVYTRFTQATIDSSFYLAGTNAGLSDGLIMELATLLGWDIDFAKDIRAGDRFSVIYEEHYLNGKKLRDGPILAVRFHTQGREVTALRYTDASGNTEYYSPGGSSVQKAFLRNPMNVFRVSSRFDPNRRHPVLNTIRAHKGTDYAAPRGTPIKATGEGKIIHAGRNGGYGIAVILQHGSGIRTLYAHMSSLAEGSRSGNRVKQGQIIGYVGATGMVTGPHLHYEFQVNGVHQNPQTVELPTANPLNEDELRSFEIFAANLNGQLDAFDMDYVASGYGK